MARLSICCINAQNYLDKGKQYVEILFDGVRRNISDKVPFDFICFTDDEQPYAEGIIKKPLPDNLNGWWNKLSLFKPGVFEEGQRVVFLDLDTVVVGGLDYILRYQGSFATLRDFWRPEGLGPAVILWTPTKETEAIYTYFTSKEWPDGYRSALDGRGDQAVLEEFRDLKIIKRFDCLQDLFPRQFKSYKTHCVESVPKGTKVVCFHGTPRPHEVKDSWVQYCWKIGGGSVLEMESTCNTADSTIEYNIRNACSLPIEHLADQYSRNPWPLPLAIMGGGPSLKETLPDIKLFKERGGVVWALNNAFKYLVDNDVMPDAHIMLDAREENIEFVPDAECLKLYASQCSPEVFKKAMRSSGQTIVWHPSIENIEDLVGSRRVAFISAGSSVGLKAMGLAQLFGFKEIHLYGYDSSYRAGENHAYKQPLNDAERVIEVEVNGQKFTCAAWMASQTNEFKECLNGFLEEGMVFHVHGSGLLPYVASLLCL